MRSRRPFLLFLLTLALFQALAGTWHAHAIEHTEVGFTQPGQASTESFAQGVGDTMLEVEGDRHDGETDCRCAWCAPNLHATMPASQANQLRAAVRAPWEDPAHQKDGSHPRHWNASSRDPPAAA